MKYIELTVSTTSEASELVSDAMWEFTDLGVTVYDYNDVIALQRDSSVFWDYMDDEVSAPSEGALVKCYLPLRTAEEDCAKILKEIALRKEQSGGAISFGSLETAKREVDGDDWIDVWKKHFRPLPIGGIVIVPEWISYEPKGNEKIVSLDSSMAFGTGEHETTRMCLELLQKYFEGGAVLDVGCGSGILGIAAAKLGAERCLLTDLDPVAVESAEHNARKSGVSEQVTVLRANLLDGTSFRADLILANITAEVLALLSPAVGGAIKKGGTLILSGIIAERLDFVKQKYSKYTLVEERRMGEWISLVYRA